MWELVNSAVCVGASCHSQLMGKEPQVVSSVVK